MKFVLVLFYALFSASAFGGHVTGNGGDAIVCRDSYENVTFAELLDFYEARVERGFPHHLVPTNSWQENLTTLLDRFSRYDTHPRSVVEPWRAAFVAETLLLPGITLVDIPDSEHVSFPRGCKVEQVAIQKEPKFPGDKRYTINKDIWDAFDGASRAGLVFHEILYRNLLTSKILKGPIDSRTVRFMTSILAAGRFDVLTYPTYLKLMYQDLGFEFTNIEGYKVPINSVEFDKQGQVIAYRSVLDSPLRVNVTKGMGLVAAEGESLSTSIDPSTGTRDYQIRVAKGHWAFSLNKIDYRVAEPGIVEIRVDGGGNIVQMTGVSFSWKSSYWKQPRDIRCRSLLIAPPPSGGLSCQDVRISIFVDAENDAFRHILFDANLKIVSAEAMITQSHAPLQTASLDFYPDTQILRKVTCTGTPVNDYYKNTVWTFSYRDVKRSLSCYPGAGEIRVYPNGNVQQGGITQAHIPLGTTNLIANYGFGCRRSEREWVSSPVYIGHENGRPANALISQNSPAVTAQGANGRPVTVKPGSYITLDENGAVVSIEYDFCANH